MGELGLTSEAALQVNQTLLFCMAAIFLGLACLAALTVLVFVWRECFRSTAPLKTDPAGPPQPAWAELEHALNSIELQDEPQESS